MGSNSSSIGYTADVKWELLRHFLYILEGLCIIAFNALIVATIMRHRALRESKEYVSLGALALADALNGFGTIAGGFYRIPVWLWHKDLDPVSGRFCLLTVHNVMWSWATSASCAMLVVVSTDRLLSMAIPLKHMSLSRKYMFGMVSLAYGISVASGLAIYVINWSNTEPIHTKVCWSSQAYGMVGSYIRDGANAFNTLVSVAIYCCVPICHAARKNATVAPENEDMARVNRNKRLQKQINKAVSVSCSATFLFVGLPWVAQVWFLRYNPQSYELISVWMFIIANVNPILNLSIYYHKQSHFNMALKALLNNKTMPDTIEHWTTNKRASQRKQNKQNVVRVKQHGEQMRNT